MDLLIDEDLPDPAVALLRSRGHRVQLALDRFLPGTEDYVLARAASEEGLVVVTCNVRHFTSLATRVRRDGGSAYGKLSMIAFDCPQPEVLVRTEAVIGVIEAAYERISARSGRMLAIVRKSSVRFDDL